MQDASIPPKDNTYIVGYAGQIPLMKEKCGNTEILKKILCELLLFFVFVLFLTDIFYFWRHATTFNQY